MLFGEVSWGLGISILCKMIEYAQGENGYKCLKIIFIPIYFAQSIYNICLKSILF